MFILFIVHSYHGYTQSQYVVVCMFFMIATPTMAPYDVTDY